MTILVIGGFGCHFLYIFLCYSLPNFGVEMLLKMADNLLTSTRYITCHYLIILQIKSITVQLQNKDGALSSY